jgi:1-acyl-sn-glycerol-3-phosphate acyltransferase
VLRSITDEIMYEVMQLSGQEYVDMYAQRAKEEIEAARAAAVEAVGGSPPDVAGGQGGRAPAAGAAEQRRRAG